MFLLDTMVISELRKKRPEPKVTNWLRSHNPADYYLSAITLGEISKEICREEKHNSQFAENLKL